jgi:hypothetical protein
MMRAGALEKDFLKDAMLPEIHRAVRLARSALQGGMLKELRGDSVTKVLNSIR